MSDSTDAQEVLGTLLSLTRDEELDCDGFHRHLAAMVEGTISPSLRALMDHHREICPECEEERVILARALGLED